MHEKDAFIAPALAGAAAAPFAMAGRGLWRAAQIAPLNTAGGVAMTTAMGPTMIAGGAEGRALKKQETMKRRNLAAAAGGLMKTQSVRYSTDDIRQALAIRRGLEKQAGLKVTAGGARGFWGAVLDAAEAVGGTGARNAAGRVAEEVAGQTGIFSPLGSAKLMAAGMALGVGMGAAGAVTAGTAYGIGKGTEMIRAGGRNKRYMKMVQADPELRGNRMARSYFNVLDKASPYISSEPQVAAATIRSMLEAPPGYALHPKYMKDILGVEESRQKTRFPMLRAPTFKGELPEV